LETGKYRRRIDRDSTFMSSTRELKEKVEKCISQNNQIDLFEEYFENE
jgi:dynein intermediate chain 2